MLFHVNFSKWLTSEAIRPVAVAASPSHCLAGNSERGTAPSEECLVAVARRDAVRRGGCFVRGSHWSVARASFRQPVIDLVSQ